MREYAIGVDLGGTTVKLGIFTIDGGLKESWEIPTRTENNGATILGDIAATIREKISENAITPEQIEGIGIGVPGPVDSEGNILGCVNLGWGMFNIEDKLGELTGLKVKAGNDANVAALGEMWQGGGKGYSNIVMITLGTGVGGGVVLGGKIIPGSNGAAGEIGHIPVEENEPETCGCGKHGCLEQYASANGIAFVTRRYLSEHPEASTSLNSGENKGKTITSKLIFDEAKKGDAVSLEMIRETARHLGKAAASIACVVNPEVFVLGGGMSKAGAILTEGIKEEYKKYAFHAAVNTEFALAKLGNNAGIYGGVKLVLS